MGAASIVCDASDGGFIINPLLGACQVATHNSCICNEQVALANRHLVDRSYIKFDEKYFGAECRKIQKLWGVFESTKITLLQAALSYKGGKRRVYMRARESLLLDGLQKSDKYIRMFVKPDKLAINDVEDKMPRAIQYRHPRFNLALATYLRPFEHIFYNAPGLGPSGSRVVTKGLNPQEVAQLLLLKASEFSNPIYIGCDHSKFDSTVRVEHLRFEHRQYLRTYKSRTLKEMLQSQIKNKGFTRRGIKYLVKGTRMSGDYNTGLGNSLLNRMILESWCSGVKHEIMLDGDDSIIIVEKQDYDKLDPQHFERMGFETKIELADDISHVEFCKKRLVLGKEPCMVRDPVRVLSNMGLCLRKYHPTTYRRWVQGVYECERKSNPGMPIFRAFPDLGIRSLKDDEYNFKMLGLERMRDSEYVARVEFQHTWGISEHMQKFLEKSIATYLGWDCTDITGYYQSVLSSIVKLDHVNEFDHVSEPLYRHQASIDQRFRALCTSHSECWLAIG